jgi:TRIAD3 protein (E3 ubiquitin-protein ligase RNF216)
MSAAAVVDLCDSDDNSIAEFSASFSIASAPIPVAAAVSRAARPTSQIINLDDSGDECALSLRGARRGKKRRRQSDETNFRDNTKIDNDDSEALDFKPAAKPTGVEIMEVRQTPKTALDRVYEVFPDVERGHADKLLRENGNNFETVVAMLAERSYPKQRVDTIMTAGASPSSIRVKRFQKDQPKYDYLSPSSFEPSSDYIIQAKQHLIREFPFLNQKGIGILMKTHKNHYSIIQGNIHNTLMGRSSDKKYSEEEEEQHFHLLNQVLASNKPSPKQVMRLGSTYVLKTKRPKSIHIEVSEPILKEEIKYAKKRFNEWMNSVALRMQRVLARKKSQRDGTAMECPCCFDDVAIDEMVACRDEGHLFCVGCIRRYAETQIFSNGNLGMNKKTKKPALELLCCHESGCQSPFQEAHLRKALPKKTLEKYNELQFRAVVEQAGLIQDLCSCPKCGFQMELPETERLFRCPVEDCQTQSCRLCGKAPHIPYGCDEVIKLKRQDEGRLKVEEAISRAKIRTCPKCKRSFIKSDGCNKMKCPCGLMMCYICRKPVPKNNPYSHFCQTPHCNHKICGKCTLYSNDKEDDERAMREAGVDAAEAYQSELLQNDQNADVELDVDKILGKPGWKRKVQRHR